MIVPSDKVWTFKEPLVKTLPVALQGTRQLKMKKKSENDIVAAVNNNKSLRTKDAGFVHESLRIETNRIF